MSTPRGPEQEASGDPVIVLRRPRLGVIPAESDAAREWKIQMAEDTVLADINSLLNCREIVIDGLPAINLPTSTGSGGLSSETNHLLFDSEGHPVKLLRVSPGYLRGIPLSNRGVARGGNHPYHVLFVNRPANYEDERGTHVIDFSSGGVDISIQLLDTAPEHIKKAAELAEKYATQS